MITRRILVALAASCLLSGPALAAQTSSGIDTTSLTIPLMFANGGQEVGQWDLNNLAVVGGVTATGSAVVSGSVTALYYAHMSDVRLKTDIHLVDNALDRLLAIHGVAFTWKRDNRRDMGVIAQNVATVFPDVVHTNGAGFKSVEYDSLIAPMIEAIRQLKYENDSLAAAIKDVNAKLDAALDTIREGSHAPAR